MAEMKRKNYAIFMNFQAFFLYVKNSIFALRYS